VPNVGELWIGFASNIGYFLAKGLITLIGGDTLGVTNIDDRSFIFDDKDWGGVQ
jgi:hypothetical protein